MTEQVLAGSTVPGARTGIHDACQRCAKVVPWASLWGNFSLGVYKLAVGVLGGSAALVADAMHSLTDSIGSAGVVVARWVSAQPANDRYPYGRGKAEFMSAVYVYTVLSVFSIGIIAAALSALATDAHPEPPHFLTPFGSLVSVVYNYLMYKFCSCVGTRLNSPAIIADAFENRTDAISSGAAIIGIVAAIVFHPACDALAAAAVGAIILWNSIERLVGAARGLMDSGLAPDAVTRIRALAGGESRIHAVIFVKTRQIGAGYWVDLGVTVRPEVTVEEADSLAEAVQRRLLVFPPVSHAEVYVYPEVGGVVPEGFDPHRGEL